MNDNFFDNDDIEPDIDMGIFDEEDADAPEVEEEKVVEEPVEEEAPEEESEEEAELVQVGDIVVDTDTGEVVAQGDDLIPDELPTEPEPPDDLPTDEELDELFGTTGDETLVETGEEGHKFENPEEEHEEVSPAEEPEKIVKPTGNAIEDAINLMTFKHINDLDPRTVKLEDCDFGQFETEMKEAQDIVDKYYERGFETNPHEAEVDLGKLSAIMVRISRAVGFYQGGSEQLEEVRKFAKSALYTEFKELRDKHSLRISDKDADHAARMMAGKYMVEKARANTLGKMVTNFWYATRKFIDVLEGIIIRNRSEHRLEQHAEAAIDRSRTPEKIEEPARIEEGFDFDV